MMKINIKGKNIRRPVLRGVGGIGDLKPLLKKTMSPGSIRFDKSGVGFC